MSRDAMIEVREACARDRMPGILSTVTKDNPGEQLPNIESYCLRALSLSAKRNALLDLYVNLALEEQGYSGLYFSEQAKLLSHDETGQTEIRILQAANAGSASYTSIAGKPRELPCPMALDAGYGWAYRNEAKPLPFALTEADARETARRCYAGPSTKSPFEACRSLPRRRGCWPAPGWDASNGFSQRHRPSRNSGRPISTFWGGRMCTVRFVIGKCAGSSPVWR